MDRLWKRTARDGDCWVWQGCKDGGGYGTISVGGRPLKTHRLAWQLTYGAIPAGMLVCHHCDRPSCINPQHPFLGTNADNMQDKVRKGRRNGGGGWHKIRGGNNGSAKLTEKQVAAMRALHCQGVSERRVASSFGISKSQVHRIVCHQNW